MLQRALAPWPSCAVSTSISGSWWKLGSGWLPQPLGLPTQLQARSERHGQVRGGLRFIRAAGAVLRWPRAVLRCVPALPLRLQVRAALRFKVCSVQAALWAFPPPSICALRRLPSNNLIRAVQRHDMYCRPGESTATLAASVLSRLLKLQVCSVQHHWLDLAADCPSQS